MISKSSVNFYFKLIRGNDSYEFFHKYNAETDDLSSINFETFSSYFTNLRDTIMVINGLACIPDPCNVFKPVRLIQEGAVKYYIKYNGHNCMAIEPNSRYTPFEIEFISKRKN